MSRPTIFRQPELHFWTKKGQKGPKMPNSISPKPLTVECPLTSQNDLNKTLSVLLSFTENLF